MSIKVVFLFSSYRINDVEKRSTWFTLEYDKKKNTVQQLKRLIFQETVLQFIILYTNIEKEKYYTIDEKRIIVNGRRMHRIFLHLASQELVSDFLFSGNPRSTLAWIFNPSFPGLLGQLPRTPPSEITDCVAWVKNKLAWLVS